MTNSSIFSCLLFCLALVLFCTSGRQLSDEREGETCIFEDHMPKMGELQHRGIIGNITDYSTIGTCLLKDDYGVKINKLKTDFTSITERVKEILRLWLSGDGATPVSWAGLVACLKEATLLRLANETVSAYCEPELKDSRCLTRFYKKIQAGIICILCCTLIATTIVVTLFTELWLCYPRGLQKQFGRDSRIITTDGLTCKSVLHILVTGGTGAGKSALVNSIIGEGVAKESEFPNEETTVVTKHKKEVGKNTLFVYDSPGLQDSDKEQYLKNLKQNCKEVDLNLYCVRMNDKMHESDTMKKLSDAFGKEEFWQKTLFVLTFANEITLHVVPPLDQYFRKVTNKWKNLLRDTLIKKAGITKGVAENVPVVTASYSKVPSLPAAKCDCWLNKLWFQLLEPKFKKADDDWKDTIIDHLQRTGKNSLCILVTGRTGTGKSALVNSIIGEDVAEEGDSPFEETEEVTMYEKSVGIYTISMYDSPGLQNDNKMEDLKDLCSKVDLNLYCIKMDGTMRPSECDPIIKLSRVVEMDEFWQKTRFVLTFANKITRPTLAKYFRQRKIEWQTLLQGKLAHMKDITKEVATNVPVVPAGYFDKPSLPAADLECWFNMLRCKCEDRIKDIANPQEDITESMLRCRCSEHQFKGIANSKKDTIKKNGYKQSNNQDIVCQA